eukprot:INCI15424.2.p1 GENE.INCI15424.2~~INCI15424.2.p1  ORF type:complete len:333 (+),score=35.81 INCI15424.2:151-1149(+)
MRRKLDIPLVWVLSSLCVTHHVAVAFKTRDVPDVIVAGAMKAGTTSLSHDVLSRHPGIAISGPEVHFADTCGDVSLQWESTPQLCKPHVGASFSFINTTAPSDKELAGCTAEAWAEALPPRLEPQQLIVDKSPRYIALGSAVHVIRKVAPKAKVIVLLRDPVERVFSQFKMERSLPHMSLPQGLQTYLSKRSVADAFHRQVMLFMNEYDGRCDHNGTLMHMAFERGFYCDQLEHLWNLIPSDQVLVQFSEDLWSPGYNYTAIDRFLGLKPPLLSVVKPTVGSSWSLQSTIHEDMHDKTKVSGLVELGELSKTVDTATHQRLVWWADYRCIAS